MSISILDIESYCRVCLHVNETNLSIFDEVQEFNMSIGDLLVFYGEMTIADNDIYPKIICDECVRELLVVAKFKEKVKHSEDTFSRLISSNDKNSDAASTTNDVVEGTEVDVFTIIKDENEIEEVVSESYEEVEFLDLHGQTDGIQYVAIDKTNDDEYIDEIIEECSLVDSEMITDEIITDEIITDDVDQEVNISNRNITKKSVYKQVSQHLNASDSKVIINFNCVVCGAGFMHSSNLKKHMTTHGSEPCSVNLNETNDTVTNIEEISESQIISEKTSRKNVVKPHKCEHCDRAFVSKSLLMSHVRTHTGERPYACNQCDKNFATQGGLDLHTRRHLGLKNYVCNICDRRFVESSNLKVHMRTHTGERPHRCNRCNRSFSRVFLLQIHQRTHTGERPFECETCHKCFAQQGDLSAHRRIHSGERPHQCPICFKGFIKSSALTSHLRRHADKVMYEGRDTKKPV